MGRIKRPKSISHLFIYYIICFLIVIPLEVLILCGLFTLGLTTGRVLPSNYYEQIVEKNREEIASVSVDEIKNLIPDRCVYAVFDTDGNAVESNVDSKETDDLLDVIINGKPYGYGRYYKIIPRESGTCIVGYTLTNMFSNEYLNKFLPTPAICTIILFFIVFIIDILLFAKSFAKRLSKEMKILNDTTENITMDNLEFEVKYSGITEINSVLSALEKMKDELYKSLKIQWKKDNERQKQIGALAHDIKTPLTIIKGNSELLNECNLNEEQSEFNKNVLNEVCEIEKYVQYLLEIMQYNKDVQLRKEKINLENFIKEIQQVLYSISRGKNLQVIIDIKDIPSFIIGDRNCLKRAVTNIISNAVDYSNEGTDIKLSVENVNDKLKFIIEDSGRGFTKEELKYATEEFFQGDKSRSAKNHYGMGLYIAANFIEKHGGKMILSNSEILNGAKVEIELPVKKADVNL